MPMNAEQALRTLESHFIRLLSEVYIFKKLYSDREMFDLVGDHLHDLFAGVQRPLLDSMVLCICRLLDPAETGRSDNITFYYLANLIPSERDDLVDRLDDLRTETELLRRLRNKIIGHADLLAHNQDEIEYEGASHDEIMGVIPKFTEILNICSRAVRGHTVTYNGRSFHNGGPDALREILSGLHHRRADL